MIDPWCCICENPFKTFDEHDSLPSSMVFHYDLTDSFIHLQCQHCLTYAPLLIGCGSCSMNTCREMYFGCFNGKNLISKMPLNFHNFEELQVHFQRLILLNADETICPGEFLKSHVDFIKDREGHFQGHLCLEEYFMELVDTFDINLYHSQKELVESIKTLRECNYNKTGGRLISDMDIQAVGPAFALLKFEKCLDAANILDNQSDVSKGDVDQLVSILEIVSDQRQELISETLVKYVEKYFTTILDNDHRMEEILTFLIKYLANGKLPHQLAILIMGHFFQDCAQLIHNVINNRMNNMAYPITGPFFYFDNNQWNIMDLGLLLEQKPNNFIDIFPSFDCIDMFGVYGPMKQEKSLLVKIACHNLIDPEKYMYEGKFDGENDIEYTITIKKNIINNENLFGWSTGNHDELYNIAENENVDDSYLVNDVW